jgi:DeoR/GlpR family transcriptional regulator of sugar metabolism
MIPESCNIMKNNRRAVAGRQQTLLQMVTEKGEISVDELAERFAVSPMTIRRDLSVLADKGLLVRNHGSASSVSMAEKLDREKKGTMVWRNAISSYAATLVEDGETLFINGSRTALGLLNYIGDKNVRVITNNGWVLNEKYPDNIRIRLTGGDVYEHVLIGEFAVESLLGFYADKLFIGCAAVYEDGEFRYDIPTEIGINEMMISRTNGGVYILADHSKLKKRDEKSMVYGSFRYSIPVTLITDEEADPVILQSLVNTGIRVLTISLNGQLTEGISE